ncbi:MAG: hypothetical protein K2H29_11925 [Oscillospiraceae bacterium]|nr:hypothetical protein [Oscillospiraceae bacterium]MDE5885768.1 hypothetical protein [Oscillospiraceae bacterium]
MPYYPYSQNSTEHSYQYEISTFWKQLVAEYTGLNFLQIGDLNFLQYLAWRRDAFIRRLEQSEQGREYLDNAWRMEQTKPDRKALREKLTKGQ